ncbi:hypothetical protein CCACVL1_21464 [Corchorus capsularis]|uniref:Uncharacterized protein n=1 Tax=Corchorus capsularis TaxID=210143 RepID=A0A1R3H5P1_COCAP|nr:hypothetical protein CCACVL1_21464 [Corchorus capsularis]
MDPDIEKPPMLPPPITSTTVAALSFKATIPSRMGASRNGDWQIVAHQKKKLFQII